MALPTDNEPHIKPSLSFLSRRHYSQLERSSLTEAQPTRKVMGLSSRFVSSSTAPFLLFLLLWPYVGSCFLTSINPDSKNVSSRVYRARRLSARVVEKFD